MCRPDNSSRGVLPSVVYLSECYREASARGGPGSLGAVASWRKKNSFLQALRRKMFSHSLLIPYELCPSTASSSNMWYP